MKHHGTITAQWDCCTITDNKAKLNIKTGYVESSDSAIDISMNEDQVLEEEYFTDSNDGKMYKMCPRCREYILRTEMIEGVGRTLYEVTSCMNPDCIGDEEEMD